MDDHDELVDDDHDELVDDDHDELVDDDHDELVDDAVWAAGMLLGGIKLRPWTPSKS